MLSQKLTINAVSIYRAPKTLWQGCFTLCHDRMSKHGKGNARHQGVGGSAKQVGGS